MFNYITLLKKKFISFKKTLKINIFYFKNKKTNFLSSLYNFSKTNKTKTWSNVNYSIFNYKINYKAFLYYFINFCIVFLFIYFKWNSIVYYFTEVAPFEFLLSIPTYKLVLSTISNLVVSLFWFLFFIINSNILSFFSIDLISYYIPVKRDSTLLLKKETWKSLSKRSYKLVFTKNFKYLHGAPLSFNAENYYNINIFKFNKNKYYFFLIKNKSINSLLFNDFFNYKNFNISNFYNEIFILQKNLISLNKTLNYSPNSLLWVFNKVYFNSKFNFNNFFIFIKKYKIINIKDKNVYFNESTSNKLLSFYKLSNFNLSKKTSSFFKKLN